VLFADTAPDFALIDRLHESGFAGAMLDTGDKRAGGLRRHMDDATLGDFVARVRRDRMISGLAGSLALADVVPLRRLGPDYLGFRGALCPAGRTSALDIERVRAVRSAIDGAGRVLSAVAEERAPSPSLYLRHGISTESPLPLWERDRVRGLAPAGAAESLASKRSE
jgi:hypothetical protein